jgi:hypothetical protein
VEASTVYFAGNFFDAGLTDIWDGEERRIGRLDLQDMFSAGVTVFDLHGIELAAGKFRFLSNKWLVTGKNGIEIGELRGRFAFFSTKFEYEHGRLGIFPIVAEPFSKEYAIDAPDGTPAVGLRKTNFFLGPASFELHNSSGLPTAEWIAVVMGIHAIERRRRNNGG